MHLLSLSIACVFEDVACFQYTCHHVSFYNSLGSNYAFARLLRDVAQQVVGMAIGEFVAGSIVCACICSRAGLLSSAWEAVVSSCIWRLHASLCRSAQASCICLCSNAIVRASRYVCAASHSLYCMRSSRWPATPASLQLLIGELPS